MAKGSFILEGSTGKVGTLVVQRRKGATILKEYVKPSNPKTQKQIAQRVIFATVQQAAKFMKPIIDHSFEGLSVGQESINRFAKVNLDRLRGYSVVDFAETTSAANSKCFMTTKNISALIPNRYIMAQGSLVLDPKSANSKTENGLLPFMNGNMINYADEGTALGQVLNALYGYTRPGQQLTKCYIICSTTNPRYIFANDPDSPGFVIAGSSFIAARLVLKDSINWNLDVHSMDEAAIIAAIQNAFDLEKSDAALFNGCCSSNRMTVEDGEITLDALQSVKQIFDIDNASFIAAETTILSEFYGSSWLRSNSEMSLLNPPTQEQNYGLYWNAAVQAWQEETANAESRLFLEKGGDQNQAGF